MGRFYRAQTAPAGPTYEKQPLPLVGVFSNYSNNPDCSIYDSYFNLVRRMTQASNGCAWPTSGEIWSSYAGWHYTDGHIGSSGASGYWVKATPCYSADGHQLMRLSPNGGLAAREPGQMAGLMTRFGVVVGPEGYRQPMSLWHAGTTLRQHVRGGPAPLDQLTTGLNSSQAATWAGSDTGMVGAVGYHHETGTLVLIEARSANCEYRAHIWRHPTARLSGKPGELNKFILEAKAGSNGASYQYVDFSWNASGSTGYAESQYRMRVIPTKSGKIALARFVPHNCAHMAVLTPGSGNTGTLATNFNTVSCTTSYGFEQGDYYGMRHQITWDNKWVAAFAPYYYYGAGLAGLVISTDDPAKYYRLSYTSSSCGVGILPIRASGFAYAFHESNADGSRGLNVGLMDFGGDGFQTTGTLAVGAAVSMPSYQYWIDTGYTSTNYPCLMPVENWNR